MPGEFKLFTYDLEPRGYCQGNFPTMDAARQRVKQISCGDYEIHQGDVVVEACRQPKLVAR